MPQALSYVHLLAGRYRSSGTAPTHSCHIHGHNREGLIEPQQAKEWSFNDAPVPWILPTGYRNPNERVPDFPDDDNEAGGSPHKGSGSAPLAGPSAEVTTVDSVEEDDGFEMVDDGDGEPSDKVVISIPVEKVAEPEGSGLAGKTIMFESEEEDDPEVKKQIEAALDKTGLLGDLMLSEHEDESESESSNDNDDEDLNKTKRYYEGQEEGIGESGSKPSSPKAVNPDSAAVLESAGNPTGSRPDAPSRNTPLTKPGATKGKGPSSESSGKAPASKLQLLATALGVQERAVHSLRCGCLGTGYRYGRGYRPPLGKLYWSTHRTAKTGGHHGKRL